MFKLIAIVEPSVLIREGVSNLLLSNGLAQGLASIESFDDWNELVRGREPALLIVNPSLVKESLTKLRERKNLGDKCFILALVYGYFVPSDITGTFDDIIYITDSKQVFCQKITSLIKGKQREQTAPEGDCLSEREKDVLRLLVQGFANKEVAERLHISPHTVISHRKNIIEKTGIRSLAGLAVYAILNNISDMDDLQQ
ncbi:helix-turn-helix transcriptional regulator [Bacteroidales bacterium]|nr:helix-turn-helix transcriptional regulator [Bacteroidales bacterium]